MVLKLDYLLVQSAAFPVYLAYAIVHMSFLKPCSCLLFRIITLAKIVLDGGLNYDIAFTRKIIYLWYDSIAVHKYNIYK